MKKFYSVFFILIALLFAFDLSAQEEYTMPADGSDELSVCAGILLDAGGNENYPMDMNSSLILTADEPNSNPILQFTEFDFENGWDFLRIYDGTDANGNLIGEFTGTDLPSGGEQILSFAGAFYLEATSDAIIDGTGFAAEISCYSVEQAPIVAFSPDYDGGEAFLSCDGIIAFTDGSLLNPNSWTWDFGDGNTSDEQNPTHTYAEAGTYTVELIACNDFGCDTLTKEELISFDPENISCFEFIMSANGADEFSFCDGLLLDAGGYGQYPNAMNSSVVITANQPNQNPIIEFIEFNFENNFDYFRLYDGLDAGGIFLGEFTGTELPFGGEAVLSQTGGFFIETTSDGSVQADGFLAEISCYSVEQPPIVDFDPDYDPILTQVITCEGTIEFEDKSLLNPAEWTWDFGDGNTSNEQNPTHTYTEEGTYTVQLISCNDFGCDTLTRENLVSFDSQNAVCFEYNMPASDTQIVYDCQGTLFDSGGPDGFYDAEENGIFIVQPGQGTEIEFSFAEFALAGFGSDFVQLYDGAFPNATLIGSFDNLNPPPSDPFLITSGAFSVVFTSFSFSSGEGFVAYWDVVNEVEPPVAAFSIPDNSIPFNSPVQFIDESANFPGQWEWTFSNDLISNQQNPIVTFTEPGEYTVELSVSNCAGTSTAEAQTFTIQTPPQLVQNDDDDYEITLCDNDAPYEFVLDSGQDTTVTFSIGNFPVTGTGELTYDITGLGNAIAGFTQVLVYDWGDNESPTYTNPVNQILSTVPNVNIYNTNTSDPSTLELELESKQVFIVLAHENDLDESRFDDFSGVLQSYVENGGTVVFFGQSNSNETNDPNVIFNSGLIEGVYDGDNFDGPFLSVDNFTHPITTGLPTTFQGQVSTTLYDVQNENAETLVSFQGYDMVSVQENIGIGGGNVVFVGLNYAFANESMLQMLTNIVQWGSNVTNVQWLDAIPPTGIVSAGSFEDITLDITTENVPDGTYTYFVTVSTNDSDNPECITPVTITVIGRPEIEVSADTLDFGEVIQFTEESLILTIFNTGNDTLFINDIFLDDENFTLSDTNFIVFPGLSQSIVITYSPDEVETIEGLILTILSNDADEPVYEVVINAEGVGAPIVDPNPDPVEITLNVDEQGSVVFDVGNIGLSDLEFCINTIINSGSGYLLTFTTDFFPAEFFWNVTDEDGNIVTGVEPGTYTEQTTTYEVLISEGLDPNATYTLNLLDTFGDGAFGDVPYTVTDAASGTLIAEGLFDFATNDGEFALATLTGFSTWLSLEGEDCGISEFPDGITSYEVLFDATGLIGGQYFATIIITSNDPTNPTIEVPVIMNVVGVPEIAVEADETLDFGSVLIGNTNSLDIVISNTGTDTLFIDEFVSAFGDAFQVEPSSGFLLVGESQTFTITFVPGEILDYSGIINILNNDETIDLNIIAFGQGAPVTELDTEEIVTTLQAGNCESFVVTVSNVGEGPLEYDVVIPGAGFEFTFTTDFFPTEFYWEVVDGDGNIALSVAPGTYTEQETEYTELLTGLSGLETYTLRLLDTFGDGALAQFTVTDIFTGNVIVEGSFPTGDLEEYFIGSPFEPQLTITPESGVIDFPGEQLFAIEICAENLLANSYEFDINFITNEPNNSPLIIPVTMNVIAFPQANFTADNDELVCGEDVEIQFSDNSINTPTSWLWDFGDGTTSTDENPTHIYDLSGMYDVSLIVSNDIGTDTITYESFINVDLNCLDESIPANSENLVVGCNGTVTDSGGDVFYVNDSNGTIVIYAPGASSITLTFLEFSYDVFDTLYVYDGPDITSTLVGGYNNANPISPGFSFTSTGEYITLYEVTDAITGAGFSGFEATFTCETPDVAPIADFVFEQISPCGGDVQFTSTAQFFPNTWQWEFGDGGTSSQTNPVHTFTEDGVYEVTLLVSNANGVDVITLDVPVNVLSVDAVIPEQGEVGTPIQFFGNNEGVVWEWDFGEGTTSTSANPIHTFDNVGIYDVTVSITDFAVGPDCIGSFSQIIQILDEIPDDTTSVQLLGKAYWNVFPNPAQDFVNVVIQDLENEDILISLSDISGRVVWQQEALVQNNFEIRIPTTELAQGMYVVSINDGKNQSSQMIVKK